MKPDQNELKQLFQYDPLSGTMTWPPVTRLTASSLNSAVYSCFGILNIISPSSQLSLYPTSWKTKFRGKLNP